MKYGELISAIEAKVPGQPRSGKEQQRWAVLDGRKVTRVTYPKKHPGDIRPGTLSSIRKQLRLDSSQLLDFVQCAMSQTDYERLLRELLERGLL